MRIVRYEVERTTLLLPDTWSERIGLWLACLFGALKSHRTMFEWCARFEG